MSPEWAGTLTHMKSKFRRFHHPHLTISRTGTWKWVCAHTRNWCVHQFLISGDEGGGKCPLMCMISWVILGPGTSWFSKKFPRNFMSLSLSRDFCQAYLIFFFFPSCLLSTQDLLEFRVFSRLSWTSHAQAFSASLLEVAVICFKWVHGKSAALWTLKGLKASQAAKEKQQLPWWNSSLQMSSSINLEQSEISTAVLFLTDSHDFPVKNYRYCQIKKCWFGVILWDGVTLHPFLFMILDQFCHFDGHFSWQWLAVGQNLSLPTARRHFYILISQTPHNPKLLFYSWHVAEWAVRSFFSEQLKSTRIPCVRS